MWHKTESAQNEIKIDECPEIRNEWEGERAYNRQMNMKSTRKREKINANSLIYECINLDKKEVLYNGKMV